MKLILIVIFFNLVLVFGGYTQQKDSLHYLEAIREDGDTLPHHQLEPITVYPRNKFKSRRMEQQYWKLAMRVKKVYPYAQKAAEIMKQYEAGFLATNDPKQRKKFVKLAEKQLFDEYGPQLKKLSVSEGRILIKLIDRETKRTSYELIKDLKGGVTAFFWQGVARLFGNDLKAEYDPIVEDRLIEEIIFYIEIGVF
ncbi:DUF4294 domain-containing protein [Gaoshiqia sp. Z1-71]|uniref:DUF4294 domain-containing protein n=1 Tax=Gaoshiqia hydrogeniformans TaxID=3290090 RepID=UPI003BF8D251